VNNDEANAMCEGLLRWPCLERGITGSVGQQCDTAHAAQSTRRRKRPDSRRQAILEFFNNILPAVGSLHHLRSYVGDGDWVAGQAEITLANGNTLYVMDAFRVENGEIVEQQNHYDPRPATG